VFLIGIPLIDTIVRIQRTPRYVENSGTYHRPPNQNIKGRIEDIPDPSISFPVVKPGYPSFDYTLTIDSRGFRNSAAKDSSEIICAGDSFVEGSKVSDADIWPALLEKDSGLSVYNMGMSGSSPLQYLDNLVKIGTGMNPRYLVCMLYEGNDFREPDAADLSRLADGETTDRGTDAISAKIKVPTDKAESSKPISKRIKEYFKSSPFIITGKKLLIDKFSRRAAPVTLSSNVPGAIPQIKGLSWMPFGFPKNDNMKFYIFKPKRFASFNFSEENFLKSGAWKCVSAVLDEMKKQCDAAGITMILVYAPTAANVMLPFIAENVPASEFRDFLSLEYKNIPPPEKIYSELLSNADVIENTLAKFCGERGIEFIDMKQNLRDEMQKGSQCYFSYDQHWSPAGHVLAAKIISEKIAKLRPGKK
jgi:hypothetical protein